MLQVRWSINPTNASKRKTLACSYDPNNKRLREFGTLLATACCLGPLAYVLLSRCFGGAAQCWESSVKPFFVWWWTAFG